MNVLAAAIIYFAIVFGAAMLLGIVRVLYVVPLVGEFVAVLLEAPFLIAVMVIGARAAPRLAALEPASAKLLACGAIALGLQIIADVGVGLFQRDMMVAEQLARLMTAPGMVYLALLVLFALMPWLVREKPCGGRQIGNDGRREDWWSRGESNP